MKNKKYILALLAGSLMSGGARAGNEASGGGSTFGEAVSTVLYGKIKVGEKAILTINREFDSNSQKTTSFSYALDGSTAENALKDFNSKYINNIHVGDISSISFTGFDLNSLGNIGNLDVTNPMLLVINQLLKNYAPAAIDSTASTVQDIQNQLTNFQTSEGVSIVKLEAEHYALQMIVNGQDLNNSILQNIINSQGQQITEIIAQLTVLRKDIDPTLTEIQTDLRFTGRTVGSRIEEFYKNQSKNVSVAAGDEYQQSYGLWFRAMVGNVKQRYTNNNPAYKLDQQGATIGFDLGDDHVLGIAYTFLNSKVKDTDSRDKIASNTATLYGLYNFDNNFFVNGQIKYSRSNIKKLRNTYDSLGNVAYGKTKSDNYGGEIETGYYYNFMDNSQFIPSVSVAYDNVKVKGYQETGAGLNRKVSKRIGKQTSTNLELMLNHTLSINNLIMLPEIHTNIDYAIQRKNAGTTISIFNGVTPIYIPATKPSKIHYNIGGSVKLAMQKRLDVTLGYDFGVAKKFRSHAGFLQARVNI